MLFNTYYSKSKQHLQNDPRGLFMSFFFQLAVNINLLLSTVITLFLLKLKNIHYGKNVKFIGIPLIYKYPSSKIDIGNNVIFRSDHRSNLVGINRKCIISTMQKNAQLTIGGGSGLSGASISAFEHIQIGENVQIGANCIITDSDWHPEKNYSGGSNTRAIKIGNNVWLGLNTIVLKGVEIGDNTTIGAGSIVVSSIPANVIAAGNPCKVIRSIETQKL